MSEEPSEAHQHTTHRAVSADKIGDSARKPLFDLTEIDGVEDDHRVLAQTQRRCRVDPKAAPPALTQPGVNRLRIRSPLRGEDDIMIRKRIQVVGVRERSRRNAGQARSRLTGGRRTEKRRLHERKVTLGKHSLDQHRAHHTAPTDDSDSHTGYFSAPLRSRREESDHEDDKPDDCGRRTRDRSGARRRRGLK